jgi:hypothetical protein
MNEDTGRPGMQGGPPAGPLRGADLKNPWAAKTATISPPSNGQSLNSTRLHESRGGSISFPSSC